jgi:cytochrome c biogenesis protein
MKKNIDKTFFTNLSFSKYFICHLPFERTKESLISLFKKEFPKLKLTTNPQFVLQGQKGNISHFGSYIIHGGILVILIGAIISSFFGFSGMMFIPEGGMSNKVFLEGRKYPKPYQLPFSLKCKEFIVDYYPNGMPKGYLSQMTIFDNKERFEKVIKVNGPLDYKGLRFYQATYGIAPEPTLHLEVSNRQSGESFKLSAPFNQLMSFPDGRGYVKVVRAFDDFMRMGPTFKLEILEGDKPAETFLLERFPQFDAMHRGGKYIITLKDYTRYTGLQVKKDPGTWVVWGGSFILVLGLMISFFIIPQKIWICLIPHEKGCEVYLGAISAKRKPLFKETFNNWVSKIEETLPCGT